MKTFISFLIFCLLATCNAEIRTWTAVNGKEVEAEFVSIEKGIVKLKLKSGKVFEVPANKLSKEDNALISSLAGTDEINDNELTMDQVLKMANQPHQPIIDIPQLITATLRAGIWERETIINIHDSSFQGPKKIIQKTIARIKHAHGKYVVFQAYDEEGNKVHTEVHSYSSKAKKLLSVGVSNNGDVSRMVGTPNLKNRTVEWDMKSSQSNKTVRMSISCNKDGMGAQIKGREKLEEKVKASWTATAKWTEDFTKEAQAE